MISVLAWLSIILNIANIINEGWRQLFLFWLHIMIYINYFYVTVFYL